MNNPEKKVIEFIQRDIKNAESLGNHIPTVIGDLLDIVEEADIIAAGYAEYLNRYKREL